MLAALPAGSAGPDPTVGIEVRPIGTVGGDELLGIPLRELRTAYEGVA